MESITIYLNFVLWNYIAQTTVNLY